MAKSAKSDSPITRIGRPPLTPTDEMIEEIVRRYSSGESLTVISQSPHLPGWTTLYKWMEGGGEGGLYETFAQVMARARTAHAHALVCEAVESSRGTEQTISDLPDNRTKLGNALVAARRLRTDILLRVAARLDPETWGERISVDGTQTHDLSDRLYAALSKSRASRGEIEIPEGSESG
uniref:Putative terminase n=1 Tax=viral metagenome TaxID=1070528 RepID=A0A6M3IG54_9ZZZZ